MLAAVAVTSGASAALLARTPPMGWMSWEMFRCGNSVGPITEGTYKTQTDHLAADGYLKAGYDTIHIDDCWEQKSPARTDGKLAADPGKFPSGMKALGDYMHSKNVKFGTYTDEGSKTCGGYPASGGNEAVDAKTFASWGVDYLKVDGCGVPRSEYPSRYHAMGDALVGSGRDIVYSCSWPAYIGGDETKKPFDDMISAHCNLWRNWDDIQCSWSSLASIIDHWGDYGEYMSRTAGPGHWHDPDMLLIGNKCINDDEARSQMALWSISAAPLIMGNDLRNVSDSAKAILLNPDAIAVNQDSMGSMGFRITPKGNTEVWARNLTGGAVAVGLYNKNGAPGPAPTPGDIAKCTAGLNKSAGGYLEACGGNSGNLASFSGLTVEAASQACCTNSLCAGFSISSKGDGYYKNNINCGFTKNGAYDGYNKPGFQPPAPPAPGTGTSVAVKFASVGLSGQVHVRDIWQQKDLGTFTDSYTATVPLHGTGFLRLSAA